ncbi:MAG: hypothetical protein JNL43_02335 [Flavobacteriales bacterium]|nr:hypothetical protein [Flavobacteriales bacterium]HRH71359.1 hypothetical protein [Flavobacteriales bacterium]
MKALSFALLALATLPLVSDAQAQDTKLREFVVHEMNNEGQHVYRDSRIPDRPDTTICYIYVGRKASGPLWLRLQVRHAGFRALDMHSITFTKGNVSLSMKLMPDLVHTGNNGVMQWEWYDAPPNENEIKAIRAIIADPGVTLTLIGHKDTITRELSETERLAMQNMAEQALELGRNQ